MNKPNQSNCVQHVGWVEERNPANPVTDWEYSFCHRGVTRGVVPMDWATNNPKVIDMVLKSAGFRSSTHPTC